MSNPTLEMVRAMWTTGLATINAERDAKGFPLETYFAKLEVVVEEIKAHLQRHDLLKPQEFTVKHGEKTVTVTVDFSGIAVVRDPQDPERPFFHIPAKEA